MSIKKFKFVSPGIFLNEIDNSQLPKSPLDIGPLFIGRTRKGPGFRPTVVESFSDFVETFGNPVDGTEGGDVWRRAGGSATAPTYAAYAAQAWLANNTPTTVVRLLGRQHADATDANYGKAGWWTNVVDTNSTETTIGLADTNGGAYGLFLIDSSSGGSHLIGQPTDTTPATGTLAAIFYVDQGYVALSGTLRSGESGDNNNLTGTAMLIASTGADKEFKAVVVDKDSAVAKTVTFNFNRNSSKFIRKVFNTNPTLTNSSITQTSQAKTYWLGETFERSVTDNIVSGTVAGDMYGMIMGLETADGTNSLANFRYGAQAAKTPWLKPQDTGEPTAFEPSTLPNLFRLVSHLGGQHDMHKTKVSIQDIKASTHDSNPYGTFSVVVRAINDTDKKVVVFERFGNLNLNPSSPDYIKRRIGDRYTEFDSVSRRNRTYGEYNNKSKYFRVEVDEDLDAGAYDPSYVPFGFYTPPKPRGFTVLSTGEGGVNTYVYGTNLQGDDAATATLTVTNAGEITSGNTISFVNTATETITITGHANANAMADTTGASTNGTFAADTTLGGGAPNNATQATAIAASINLHDDFTATAAAAVVTITQNTVGTAGNTTITVADGAGDGDISAGLTIVSFTGGTANGGVELTTAGRWVLGVAEAPAAGRHAEYTTARINTGFPTAADAVETQFTGAFKNPTIAMRSGSSDGGFTKPTTAYFGFDTGRSTTDLVFDESNLDIVRPQSSGLNGLTFTSTPAAALVAHDEFFTLDNISGSGTNVNPTKGAAHANHNSGSRNTEDSMSVKSTGNNGGYKAVLRAGFNKFTMPVYGGHDGLNVKEKDPFRNSQWTAGSTTVETDYALNSVMEAIDSVASVEDLEYNLISAPGIHFTTVTDRVMEVAEERGDALAVIDLPDVYTPKSENTSTFKNRLGSVTTAVDSLNDRQINNNYACAYYPWVQIRDNIAGSLVWVPPSVAAVGAMAFSDSRTEPWFAPAGFNRGGLTDGAAGIPVVNVTEKLSAQDRDDLYDARINPIASFPAEGIVIFGQKTLQVGQSALDRINVRRLMILIKKTISRMAATVLFDQNVQVTWNRFLSLVEPFLRSVKTRLGLTDFKVVLDETTTTSDLIDRNIMYAKIFLKPARSIEYIAIDFNITRSGASFED
jgi:hypothetical protein